MNLGQCGSGYFDVISVSGRGFSKLVGELLIGVKVWFLLFGLKIRTLI